MNTRLHRTSWQQRLGKLAKRVFHDDFFDCLFGSVFLGGIIYGLCWWGSSEGAQHPILSAVFFGTFALPFAIPDMVDDLLEARFGRHSMAHIITGIVCSVGVFLLLALAFVSFFYATITLATVGTAFACVFVVIMLLYFVMLSNAAFGQGA